MSSAYVQLLGALLGAIAYIARWAMKFVKDIQDSSQRTTDKLLDVITSQSKEIAEIRTDVAEILARQTYADVQLEEISERIEVHDR